MIPDPNDPAIWDEVYNLAIEFATLQCAEAGVALHRSCIPIAAATVDALNVTGILPGHASIQAGSAFWPTGFDSDSDMAAFGYDWDPGSEAHPLHGTLPELHAWAAWRGKSQCAIIDFSVGFQHIQAKEMLGLDMQPLPKMFVGSGAEMKDLRYIYRPSLSAIRYTLSKIHGKRMELGTVETVKSNGEVIQGVVDGGS